MWIVLIGMLIAATFWVIRSASKSVAVAIREDAVVADAENQALWRSDGFSPMAKFRLSRNQYGIAIDPDSDQFAIGIAGHPPRLYNFHQLIAVEVTHDGDTVTTSKGRIDAKGAAIATALVGPIGMTLGAQTSSSSVSTERIRKLGLKLFVSDLHTPVFEIPFFVAGTPVPPDTPLVVAAIKEMNAWDGRLRTILTGNANATTKDAAIRSVKYAAPAPLPKSLSVPEGRGWAARTFGA